MIYNSAGLFKSMLGLGIATLPLYGCLPYEVEFEALQYNPEATVTIDATDNNTVWANSNIFTTSGLGKSSVTMTISDEAGERKYTFKKIPRV